MKYINYLLFFISIAILASSISNAQSEIRIINVVPVNTEFDELAPALTQHGTWLFITRDVNGTGQRVMTTYLEKYNWASPTLIKGDVNDGRQVGSVTFTPDGQYMIFAAFDHDENGEGRTDLYSARKVDGEWTDVQNLGMAINTDYFESQPSLSSDGRTLYFASDRPGGEGGTDIYVSRKIREGWTKAENLGKAINSEYNEMTPFIAYDNKTFTFASDRSGEGGFDIFFSKLEGQTFSTPRNAGNIINSPKDEFFYFVRANSDEAYYSSSREGTKGGLDIYAAVPNPHQAEKVVIVNGKVLDAVTGEPLGADIIITNLTTGEEIADLRSDDENGIYYAVLQTDSRYSITADKEDYVFYTESFDIPADPKNEEIIKDIKLTPIAEGKTTLLVFFDFDKSELKPDSKPELNRLVNFLTTNKGIRISIEGHTDDVGNAEYNLNLSKQRAASVKKYLIDKGVNEARIETKGFGKQKPLVDAKTDAARGVNRRVEMIILSID